MMDEMWQKTLAHLSEGNFTALETMLDGPDGFDRQILEWYDAGMFATEPEVLAEALSCACMLGRTETASFLIDAGVDPFAGMKTWLAGPHYAVSGAHVDTVRMLIDKGVSLEVENKYGGTLLGQALWSAVQEHKAGHGEIIEMLLKAGAKVQPRTREWWNEQNVPSAETKRRVAEALKGLG